MADPVDVHVGKRIRERRLSIEMSQVRLAEISGVRFQQIQKYELGVNRVSASRLWEISKGLHVPISYFFDGLDTDAPDVPSTLGEDDKGDGPAFR